MSVEELLRPRYKVIAGYPYCVYAVGQIITENDGIWFGCESGYCNDKSVCESKIHLNLLERYTHIFQLLEWWEDRKEDEMPEYVRYYEGFWFPKDTFIKVYKWELAQNHWWFYEEENAPAKYVLGVLPATEEEYLSQNALVK